MQEYGTEVYKALSKIIKLKFRSELKNSGIELKGLYLMKDLITEKEIYLLEINDTQIRFATKSAFIVLFINFLQKNIKGLNENYKFLINKVPGEFSNEVSIELQYKMIYFYIIKQTELLKKVMEYKSLSK